MFGHFLVKVKYHVHILHFSFLKELQPALAFPATLFLIMHQMLNLYTFCIVGHGIWTAIKLILVSGSTKVRTRVECSFGNVEHTFMYHGTVLCFDGK